MDLSYCFSFRKSTCCPPSLQPKHLVARSASFLARAGDVFRNVGLVTQRRTVRMAQMNGQGHVGRKNVRGTSGVAAEKATHSASRSPGFATTGQTVMTGRTRWSAPELALQRSSLAKTDSVFSPCGVATVNPIAEMAVMRRTVLLSTVFGER